MIATGKVRTGIRKGAGFSENLESVRSNLNEVDFFSMIEHLELMKRTYGWIKNDEYYQDMIDDIINQLTYDHVNAGEEDERIEEDGETWELSTFVCENGKFLTRMVLVESRPALNSEDPGEALY